MNIKMCYMKKEEFGNNYDQSSGTPVISDLWLGIMMIRGCFFGRGLGSLGFVVGNNGDQGLVGGNDRSVTGCWGQ